MRLDQCLNIADLRLRAAHRLPAPVFDFLEGGAEDERTTQRNRDAFNDWALVPRALRDVSAIDPQVQVLGQRLAWPFIAAPVGLPGLMHRDGEIAGARAAAATGTLYTLSTMASRSIEAVSAATSAPKAFQLYLFRDRGISRELIQRARDAGYIALILTIDIPVPANRERDKRNGMTIPPRFTPATLMRFARRPGWCWQAMRHPVRLANFDGYRARPGTTLLDFINDQFDPAIGWRDLEWAAREWGGPIAVKGLLHPDDAPCAMASGATALILSNHGGRQLDGAAAPLDRLEAIASRVGGQADLIVDGGIRRGTDMLKAMALGADACMGGRAWIYGLASGGEAGVRRALTLLRAEYERDMALLGARDRTEIDRASLVRITQPVTSFSWSAWANSHGS